MKAWTAVLALAAAFMIAPPAAAQENTDTLETWQEKDPGEWTALIDKYTPSIFAGVDSTTGHFCNPLLSGASGAVAEAGEQGRLWWDRRLPANIYGRVVWDPLYMLINPDNHSGDYDKAFTMAHEELHWAFGGTPFTYRGEWYTGKMVPNPDSFSGTDSIADDEALVRGIMSSCFLPEEEEDDDDPPPTPTLHPTPVVPSVNPNGYPVLGQDVSCTYVFNPLGGDLYCKGLTIIAEEGWYFEERLGVAFWFSSNGDGTASVTVCRPDGEWEKVCEDGDG